MEENTALLSPPPSPLLCTRCSRGGLPVTSACLRITEGVIYLVLVAAIWVGASVLVQFLYQDLHISTPFFLTYVCNSEFILLLPLRWSRERHAPQGVKIRNVCLLPPAPRSNWRAAAVAGALVCPLWFLAQGSYNWSLSGTSVSSSTVLSTTSCVFTFALSLLLLKEGFTWVKLAGVCVNVAGAVLVSFSDTSNADSSGGNTWWGDALALFSACMYALYTTAIRRLVPDGGDVDISAFFGFLGLFNAILLAPLVLTLHLTHVEDLTQITPLFVGCMLVKGLFDNVISDLLWARAIQLTSPTLATVALTLTIPMAMLSDVFIAKAHLQPLMIIGAVVVAAGFVVSTLAVQPTPPATAAIDKMAAERADADGGEALEFGETIDDDGADAGSAVVSGQQPAAVPESPVAQENRNAARR